MSKSWEYANSDADFTPEVILKTGGQNPADMFLLRNIAKGLYGSPVVSSFVEEGGFVSSLTLKFSNGSDMPISEDLRDISVDLSYVQPSNPNATIYPVTSRKSNNSSVLESFGIPVYSKELTAKISNFDRIQNLNPTLIIKRYKKEKKKTNNEGVRIKKPAGWHKSLDYISEIPLLTPSQKLAIQAEDYFGVQADGINGFGRSDMMVNPKLFARGSGIKSKPVSMGDSGQCTIGCHHLQFYIQIEKNGVNYLSEPIATIKLQAHLDLTSPSNPKMFVSYRL